MIVQTDDDDILENCLILISNLQSLDSKRFYKLKTEIEVIEVRKPQILDMINLLQVEQRSTYSYWIEHQTDNKFLIIKSIDTSQSAQIVDQLIPDSNSGSWFESPQPCIKFTLDELFKQTLSKSGILMTQFSMNGSYSSLTVQLDPIRTDKYLVKRSKVATDSCDQMEGFQSFWTFVIAGGTRVSKLRNMVNICRKLNSANLSNSITFKLILNSHINQLIGFSSKDYYLLQTMKKVLSLTNMLSWSCSEQLDYLLNILSTFEDYCPEQSEFISNVEYFSNPGSEEKKEMIQLLLKAEKAQLFTKEMISLKLEIVLLYSEKYKVQHVYMVYNSFLLSNQYSREAEQIIKSVYKKPIICYICILSEGENSIDPTEVNGFLLEIKDQIKRPKFRVNAKINKSLFEKSSKLMLSIEERLSTSIQSLNQTQKDIVQAHLVKLFVKNFLIDNQ